MTPPVGPTAQALIGALHASGWTDSAIGAAVGRNSSLIHQGATGAKPLRNLVGSLQEMVGKGTAGPPSARQAYALAPQTQPAPRLRASGTPAAVRQSKVTAQALAGVGPGHESMVTRAVQGLKSHGPGKAAQVRTLPNGQRMLPGRTVASGRLAADIADGLSPSARVKIVYQDRAGGWHTLGGRGGLDPAYLKSKMAGIRRGTSLADVIAEIAADVDYQDTADGFSGFAEFWIV